MKQKELIDRLVKANNNQAKECNCISSIDIMYVGSKVVYSFEDHFGDTTEIQSNTLAEFIDILIPPVKKEET